MNLLKKFVYWFTVQKYFTKVKEHHLETITGIENLPKTGPFIVIANHSSFADHYLIGALFKHLYGNTLYYLTKKESFNNRWSKFWHEATNCIPIDREKPDISAFKAMLAVLKDKKILVIYPEGTRGPGDHLLPFKSGAFKIASRMNVPIIPIGLVGVSEVLPKTQSTFNPNKAIINVGKMIPVEFIKKHPLESLMEYTRERIYELSLAKNLPSNDIYNLSITNNALVQRVENHVEDVLERGDYARVNQNYDQYIHALDYALINIPNYIPAIIQRARLIGIKALSSKLDLILNIRKVKKLAELALAQDNNHAFGNYILGQYYLKLPFILGGNNKKALTLISKAFQKAPLYGVEQSKFTLTLAEAYEKTGARESALQMLQIAKLAQGEGARFETRKQKILNKIDQLELVLPA